MVNLNTALGEVFSFPVPKQNPELQAENWIHQILESKDNLVTALELLRDAHNAMLAGGPLRNTDEILAVVEAILTQAEKMTGNVALTATGIDGSSLQRANQKQLLLFPSV